MSEKTTLTLKNKEKVTIRWAEIKDARTIVRLELESALYENRAEPITISEAEFTKYWEERLSGDNYKTLLVCGANRLYGFLTFVNEIKLGQVLALYIDPAYMRLGIGSNLMRIAEQMVILKGGKSIEVEVETQNKGGLVFYENLGLKRVGYVNDHLIKMVKEL
ncbi:N-acetyltransferase [Succinivibrio sp.]|jgi:ribosomal protein S18 acetylase RimI-like enzyme|uniref:GNAT family N-acetyltransferase n=1 Tax=Succinivibrio sp. TaxID=2053619 RepID=UPI0025D1D4EF|nr:GNAT family N-acetyltransferase [uncultured Succinivibrio sp.]MBQ3883567.1 GNAT family N-acetyltransferase [Succinivibrio sp.]